MISVENASTRTYGHEPKRVRDYEDRRGIVKEASVIVAKIITVTNKFLIKEITDNEFIRLQMMIEEIVKDALKEAKENV